MASVGAIIYKVLVRIKADDTLLLKRVFDEQYEVSHGSVIPRDKRQIAAGSVQDNRGFAADNLIDFVTSGLQGKPSRYDLTLEGDELTVVDKSTGEKVPVTRAGDKWRIDTGGKSRYRYFTREDVKKAQLRRKLGAVPIQELNRRNNVEAAMFQISYHTRNNKTRYRGLSKHVMWACSRCMWINFMRLAIFHVKAWKDALSKGFSHGIGQLEASFESHNESHFASCYRVVYRLSTFFNARLALVA